MNEYESLSHTTWDCKYHVVFIPKCRRKTLYLGLRCHLGEVFHKRRLKSLIILKCCWSATRTLLKVMEKRTRPPCFFDAAANLDCLSGDCVTVVPLIKLRLS